MAAATSPEITRLLDRWKGGDSGALHELMDRVQPELRSMARRLFRREGQEHTLQPTALVNELYLRLMGKKQVAYEDRAHFFAAASRIMRHMLIDHARRAAARRKSLHVTLEEGSATAGATGLDVLALDEALQRLEGAYPREAQVVELRCFGGMTIEETAAHLGVAPGTVKRDWRFARSFLQLEMEQRRP